MRAVAVVLTGLALIGALTAPLIASSELGSVGTPLARTLALIEDRPPSGPLDFDTLKSAIHQHGLAPATVTYPLTEEALNDTRLLVLTEGPFSETERARVADWVETGGSLLLLGDKGRANWTTPHRFGVLFGNVTVRDSFDYHLRIENPIIHHFEDHPIVADISGFVIFTGVGMELTAPAERVAFAHPFSTPSDATVLAVSCAGTGVVAALGDTNAVDDEGVQTPFDNVRLVVNLIDWLMTPPSEPCPTSNRPPQADAGPAYSAEEGAPVALDASGSSDPDGDSLRYRWDFDGDGAWDTSWSPSPGILHTYGDDWQGRVRVQVSDGEFTALASAEVTVGNVAPALEPLQVTPGTTANVTLRVAGERWHDVAMTLYHGGAPAGTATVVRTPGSPDDQSVTIDDVPLGLPDGPWSAVVTYTPLDDPVNGQTWGANPVWLILTTPDGTEARLHHTFNVRHPDTWSWVADDLADHLPGLGARFEVTARDPGSDDLTVTWTWGDGSADESHTYFNDGAGPDPFPSPDVNPIQVSVVAAHAFPSGTYTITVTVVDDDGGFSTQTFVLVVP